MPLSFYILLYIIMMIVMLLGVFLTIDLIRFENQVNSDVGQSVEAKCIEIRRYRLRSRYMVVSHTTTPVFEYYFNGEKMVSESAIYQYEKCQVGDITSIRVNDKGKLLFVDDEEGIKAHHIHYKLIATVYTCVNVFLVLSLMYFAIKG